MDNFSEMEDVLGGVKKGELYSHCIKFISPQLESNLLMQIKMQMCFYGNSQLKLRKLIDFILEEPNYNHVYQTLNI